MIELTPELAHRMLDIFELRQMMSRESRIGLPSLLESALSVRPNGPPRPERSYLGTLLNRQIGHGPRATRYGRR